MIFWGAQNIAGESSLKIPYGTIAVKTRYEPYYVEIFVLSLGIGLTAAFINTPYFYLIFLFPFLAHTWNAEILAKNVFYRTNNLAVFQ